MEEKTKKIELEVSGMHCATCALSVEKGLSATLGVKDSSVNLATGKALVTYDPEITTLTDLTNAVERAGFNISTKQVRVKIGNMTCASCVQAVTKALNRIEGIISVDVNLSTEKAHITYNPSLVDIQVIRHAIESAGYSFQGTDDGEKNINETLQELELKSQLHKIIIGFSIAALLMGMMIIPLHNMQLVSYIQFIITTPVLIWLGFPIFRAATGSLRTYTLTMDVMYAMGIGVAYIASVLGTFSFILDQGTLFYETTLMLTSFLMLGRYLETRAKGRTSSAITALIGLKPDTAMIIREGTEVPTDVDDIVTGDIIQMRPGERIPVDGVVVFGSAYIDESMVTGEPLAVLRQQDDEVIGGTLITTGAIRYQATRIGADTMLSRIIRLVEEAQGSKPPVQRLADYVVAWFIPAVLIVAILSGMYWYIFRGMDLRFSLQTLIAVLVVACPCALGLATPTAVTVGIGRGAELGILIRNGTILEVANKITLALFDKTGTITRGRPEVTDIDTFSGTKELLLSMAASLEYLSEHPIGRAILARADSQGIEPGDVLSFHSETGSGLSGIIAGQTVRLGTRDFVLSDSLQLTREQQDLLNQREIEGKTTILIARDEILLGLISIADTVKPGSDVCIWLLQGMGIKSGMVTGDNQVTADAIAGMAGIPKVFARVLPEGKEQEVKNVQDAGEVVAFIGDGINDAPALARSDIGIAIGSGTDVAIESADIILVKDDLIHVPAAIELAGKVMGRIRLNLFWAFAYNIILIPLAAGILYPFIVFRPEYGALAMALSSVTIVSLSLLLNSYTPPSLAYSKPDEQTGPPGEKDPVCGMMVDPKATLFKTEYQGKKYYFCNKGCREAFEKDPSRYIS